jgi:hypothetical protein
MCLVGEISILQSVRFDVCKRAPRQVVGLLGGGTVVVHRSLLSVVPLSVWSLRIGF